MFQTNIKKQNNTYFIQQRQNVYIRCNTDWLAIVTIQDIPNTSPYNESQYTGITEKKQELLLVPDLVFQDQDSKGWRAKPSFKTVSKTQDQDWDSSNDAKQVKGYNRI